MGRGSVLEVLPWCVTGVGVWSILEFSTLGMLNLRCTQIPKLENVCPLSPNPLVLRKKQGHQKLCICFKLQSEHACFPALPLALETGGHFGEH